MKTKEKKMTPSQRALQKLAQMENVPILSSEDADCCCMIAPWVVVEEGRGYQLKITKKGQTKALMSDKIIEISVNEPPSNKKNNRYELHIVAPSPDKNGNPTYKKITSNHRFLRKKCNLTMIARSSTQEKEILEGGSFKIDSDGKIEGAFNNLCAAYAPKDEEEEEPLYRDNLENTTQGPWGKPSDSEFRAPKREEELSDLEIMYRSIFDPKGASSKIELVSEGATKCKLNPKAILYIHPSAKYSATFRAAYAKERRSAHATSYRKFNVTAPKWELSFNGKGNYGTRTFAGSLEHTIGGQKYTRNYTPQERRKIQQLERVLGKDRGHLLSKIERFLAIFEEAEKENKEFIEQMRREATGSRCPKYYPAFTFNPGKVGFMVGVTDYRIKEIPSDYRVDSAYRATLKINLFTGSEIKVDIISLLIARVPVKKAKEILLSLRKDACEGKSGNSIDMVVELSLTGGGALKLDMVKELNRPLKVEGKGSVTVGAKAKAGAKGEFSFWVVSAGGELSGTIASAKHQAVPCGMRVSLGYDYAQGCFKGKASFTGLALYYVLRGYVKRKDEEEDKKKAEEFFKDTGISTEVADKIEIFPSDSPKEERCIDMARFLR